MVIYMQTVFFVCFWSGIVITGINALLGLIFGIFDFGIDTDFDFEIGDFDLGAFLPASPSLIFLGMIIFGGTGMMLTGVLIPFLTVLLALLISLTIIVLLKRFVIYPLRKISSIESGTNDDYIGMTAHVSDKIFSGEYGKITLLYDDNTVSCTAKASDDSEISTGTEVVILSRENNVFIVEALPVPKSNG